MNTSNIRIVKRDGKTEAFSLDKISNAIRKAYAAGGVSDENGEIASISERVAKSIETESITVEQIQDKVERELMLANPYIAKKYILYRQWRNAEREKRTSMKSVMDGHIERYREEHPEAVISDGEILALCAEDIADIYGRESYECTVIAVFAINDEEYDGFDDNTVFTPGSNVYDADFGLLTTLDIAEATVADNNLVDEYREFGHELAGGSVTEGVMFVMDTSKLENLRNTLRLVEMLYPIAVVVTLVIGAFLCGLIIVQTSKDIAIMRVLGTSKAKTRTILVLEQMILCIIGIIISGGVLYIRGAFMQMLWVFGAYALVILLASIIASVAASRKNVLELLQTKE